MVFLSGDGKGWVNPSEQGKHEWREWCDEWAGGWKKQQSPELRRSLLLIAHRRVVKVRASLPAQAGVPALESEEQLGLQWLNLAGQRWKRVQQQGEICLPRWSGTAWGRVGAMAPSFPSPLCPPR